LLCFGCADIASISEFWPLGARMLWGLQAHMGRMEWGVVALDVCGFRAVLCTHAAAAYAVEKLALLVVARTIPPEELLEIRSVFEALDVDGSGMLTFEEMCNELEMHQCEVRLRARTGRQWGPAELMDAVRSQSLLPCGPCRLCEPGGAWATAQTRGCGSAQTRSCG
jgi:hypothetical protein